MLKEDRHEDKPLVTACIEMRLNYGHYAFPMPMQRAENQKEAERYILESERQWAESVATGDASAIERILADDFVGVDPKACSTTSNRWSPTPGTRRNTTFPISSMT